MSAPFWISAFLDAAPAEHAEVSRFWSAVTGYDVSAARGEHAEFTTLVPPEGDDFLRIQRLARGPSRIHLDLHVEDPGAEADAAVDLGAHVLARPAQGYVVLASPGGLVFCLVTHPAARRPPPRQWGAGHLSLVDQVCLDIPGEHWATETAFWPALTGQRLGRSPVSDAFATLQRPPALAVRLLLQRLEEPAGPVRAHLDLATTDRAGETARHLALGAAVEEVHEVWTVLRAPGGAPYCLTDRDPRTGLLPGSG